MKEAEEEKEEEGEVEKRKEKAEEEQEEEKGGGREAEGKSGRGGRRGERGGNRGKAAANQDQSSNGADRRRQVSPTIGPCAKSVTQSRHPHHQLALCLQRPLKILVIWLADVIICPPLTRLSPVLTELVDTRESQLFVRKYCRSSDVLFTCS